MRLWLTLHAFLICFGISAGARAEVGLLAVGRSFEPLVADPRWPRFAASWQEYDDPLLDSVAAVALGGTFALVHGGTEDGVPAPWEVGVQTAVFGTYEPLESSQDLFNSDWQVGLYTAGRHGDFSGMLRLWHQSSHLGDEFLLRNPGVQRINFTFESLSGLGAYEPTEWSRFYAGGGWIFDENPDDFGNWFVQYGLELRWPRTIFNGYARPFAAIDVQHYEATGWGPDVSIVTGLELRDPGSDGLTMRAVVEFYDGRNLNGQFFREDTQYLGGGLQLRL